MVRNRNKSRSIRSSLLCAAVMACAFVHLASGRPVDAGVISVANLPPGSPGDTTADGVLGQVGFVQIAQNFRDGRGVATSFFSPGFADVAIDRSVSPNRVFAADPGNNRVLGWSNISLFASHAPATIVIGQPNVYAGACNQNAASGAAPSASTLCFPTSVAVDSAGRLYVADRENNRVLMYIAPFTTDRVADDVFGQDGGFESGVCNAPFGTPTAATLCKPSGVAVDAAGNLYASDTDNNRALEYNTPEAITAAAGSGDTTADRVFGQGNNFSTVLANQGGGPSSTTLSGPRGLTVDVSNNLYIADLTNNRVLIYVTPLTTNTTADKVLGQNTFFSAGCNQPGDLPPAVAANSLCKPVDVATDASKNLYVADGNNSRVLEYNIPVSSDTTADRVFGQTVFTAGSCNQGASKPSAKTLCNPSGVGLDVGNNLYVADGGNNRELQYNTPLSDATADGVLSQVLFSTPFANEVDQFGIDTAFSQASVAIDKSVSPNRVYVADYGNNRVLAWNDIAAFTTHAGANLVFGQPNFFTNDPNNGGVKATTLNLPISVAVDKSGNLYVADMGNNRVLEYNTPFASGTTADKVFGQANNFTTNACNALSANSLCGPLGVAVDLSLNVYISDSTNNRILEYNTPLTTDRTADRVFGQANFVSASCNKGLANPTSATLCTPFGLALDSSNNLFAADNSNNRVLEYVAPLTNAVADKVFGQGNVFTTATPNKGGLSATSLQAPQNVALDSAKNLYVVDRSNNRVLRFNALPAFDVIADKVFGQNNLFNQNGCGFTPSPTTLCVPDGAAVDASNNLYVGDTEDHRILKYLAP